MAMRDQCISAVEAALGRALKSGEAADIVARIQSAHRRLSRHNPQQWQALSDSQRLTAAATLEAQQVLHAATKKAQRAALSIEAASRLDVRNRQLQTGKGKLRPFRALARILGDADRYVQGVSNENFSSILETIQSVETQWLGFIEDPRYVRDFLTEIYGKQSGNASSAKAAKVWLDAIEGMRTRFNASGGDVGKLDYGYVPQLHNQRAIALAGADAWTDAILPLLDRSRYVDELGHRIDDAGMRAMLGEAWETLASGGLNKQAPGAFRGSGMRANRGSDSRVLHFAGADEHIAYQQQFGRGGLFGAMQSHVGGLSRDTALVEFFGPNPEQQFRVLHDTAMLSGDSDLVGFAGVRTQHMWDSLSGKTNIAVHTKFAEIGQGTRNVETFGKLGSAFLSSVTDIPTYFLTSGFHRLPVLDSVVELVRGFGKDSREFANRSGIVADSLLSDMNRWAEGNIGQGWTAQVANKTMKATLLSGWTDAIRRAFAINMMGAIGKMSRGDWGNLHATDRAHMESVGITQRDFDVWRLATPEARGSSQMLTPASLRAIDPAALAAAGFEKIDVDRATSKLLGYLSDESQFASVGQDLYTRAALTRGTQKGTVEGELLRSVALFKGFPTSMISRHWGRVADEWAQGGKASSVAYGAGLISSLVIFGALAKQMKEVSSGRDPLPMNNGKFWAAAFAQGGGVGIFGDLVYQFMGGGQSQTGKSVATNTLASVLGPVFGTGVDLADATLGNLGNYFKDKDTQVGADFVNIARGHLPLVNFWYLKSMVDHLVMHDLQEYLSPGYLGKMKGRAQRDWGQEYWYEPGETLPERGPNMEAALGE